MTDPEAIAQHVAVLALEQARAVCHAVAISCDHDDDFSAGAYECQHSIGLLIDALKSATVAQGGL